MMQLDVETCAVCYRGKTLILTPVEFRLLEVLIHNPKKALSRQQLIKRVYLDHRVITNRTIDTHIKNLRKKLRFIGVEPSSIRSIYSVGYRWDLKSVSC